MSSLIVLDQASVPNGWGPFQILREHPWTMEVFEMVYYTTELERALKAVREHREPVVVIGPGSINAYAKGEKTLRALFAEAKLPADKLVVVHRPYEKLPMVCEYKGEYSYQIPDVVFYASGLRYDGGFRPNR